MQECPQLVLSQDGLQNDNRLFQQNDLFIKVRKSEDVAHFVNAFEQGSFDVADWLEKRRKFIASELENVAGDGVSRFFAALEAVTQEK